MALIFGEKPMKMDEKRAVVAALKLGNSDEMDDSLINKALVDYAKADPRGFVGKIRGREMAIKVLLTSAEKYKLVEYKAQRKTWVWGSGIPGSNEKEIINVPTSRHQDEFMIEWLLNDNTGVTTELEGLVKELDYKNRNPKQPEIVSKHEGGLREEISNTNVYPPVPVTAKTYKNGVTQELIKRASDADMSLVGIGIMKFETFMMKLRAAEAKKEKRQLV